MKLPLIPILLFISVSLSSQSIYKGLPLVKANSTKSTFYLGDSEGQIDWVITPKIKHDSLIFQCFSEQEQVVFKTDIDSLPLTIKPNQNIEFYVLLNNKKYAHTVVAGKRPDYNVLEFDSLPNIENLEFWFDTDPNSEYLTRLRSKYPIDSVVKNALTDTERALAVMNWVHKQWKHNGSNTPSKNDPISILDEAAQGKSFRCVEYGIVLSACLNSIGMKARTVGLKTADVETRKSGAGHVLTEVYLDDLQKWALLDGQWDAMPTLNCIPLNAVEFNEAINHYYENMKIFSGSKVSKAVYVNWIYPYLYYIDASFDNRTGDVDRNEIDGKKSLMLVPIGVSEPKVFQKLFPINYCLYTHSLVDFYRSPR